MIRNKYLLFRNGELIDVLNPAQPRVLGEALTNDWLFFAGQTERDRLWLRKLTDASESTKIGRDFKLVNKSEVPEDIKLQVLLLT